MGILLNLLVVTKITVKNKEMLLTLRNVIEAFAIITAVLIVLWLAKKLFFKRIITPKTKDVMGDNVDLPEDNDKDGFRDWDLDKDGVPDSKDEDYKDFYEKQKVGKK